MTTENSNYNLSMEDSWKKNYNVTATEPVSFLTFNDNCKNISIKPADITKSQTFTIRQNKVDESHYGGTIQPLEFMQANMTKDEFMGFLKGNIIKYVSRAGKKKDNDIKSDIKKAKRYLVWLQEVLDGKIINPREL